MDEASPREVLLRHGKWIGSTDFTNLLSQKRNISVRQAKTLISRAYRDKQIKKHVFSDRTVIYGLTEFGPPTNASAAKVNVEAVRKALEDLRCELRFFREPTVKEVAFKTGMLPQVVEPVLYALADDAGWREPSGHSERETNDTVNLAGWLCWKEKREQDLKLEARFKEVSAKASTETLKMAQKLFTNYPHLAPQVTLTQITWPEETRIKWKQIFGSEAPSPQCWIEGKGFVPFQELDKQQSYRRLLRSF